MRKKFFAMLSATLILSSTLTLSGFTTPTVSAKSNTKQSILNINQINGLNKQYPGAFDDVLSNPNYKIVGVNKKYFKLTENKNNNNENGTNISNFSDNNNLSNKMIEISQEQYLTETSQYKLTHSNVNENTTLGSNDGHDSQYTGSWMLLETYAINLGWNYRIKNCFTWTSAPFYNYYDVVSVHTNGSFSPNAGSQVFMQYYTHPALGGGSTYSSSGEVIKYQWLDTGISAVFPLCDGWRGSSGVSGYVQVDGHCNNSGYLYNAFGNYAHQEKKVSYTPTVSRSGADIVLSYQTTFDIANNTNAQFTAY